MLNELNKTIGLDLPQTWYGSVVRYVKKISSRRCEEVDVVFCKFELDDGGRPKIGIPEVLPGE